MWGAGGSGWQLPLELQDWGGVRRHSPELGLEDVSRRGVCVWQTTSCAPTPSLPPRLLQRRGVGWCLRSSDVVSTLAGGPSISTSGFRPSPQLLEGSAHAYSSRWFSGASRVGGRPMYVRVFPFSLLTCHFSNSHFHVGVFTSAVIVTSKNSDCWLSSFQAPYTCYLI